MKRILPRGLFLAILFLFAFLSFAKPASAVVTVKQEPAYVDIDTESVRFTFSGSDLVKGQDYAVAFFRGVPPGVGDNDACVGNSKFYKDRLRPSADKGEVMVDFPIRGETRDAGEWSYIIWKDNGCKNYKEGHVIQATPNRFTVFPPGGTPDAGIPAIKPKASCSNFQIGTSQEFLIQNVQINTNYTIWVDGQSKNAPVQFNAGQIINKEATYSLNLGSDVGYTKACLAVGNNTGCDYSTPIFIGATVPTTCLPVTQSNQPGIPLYFDKHDFLLTPSVPPPPCSNFSTDGSKCLEVNTAIGAVNTEPVEFIKKVFGLLLGIAGGIAVVLIIVSGYRLMASQGNPEQVQGAREMLTSAVVGLLFIIFSFVILQVIGVDILKIPGFGG